MNTRKRNHILVFSITFLILFLAWAFLVKTQRLFEFDQTIQSFFFSLRNAYLTPFLASLEYLGHWPVPAVIGIIFLVMKKTRFSYGIPLAISVASSVALYEILKNIFRRQRPDELLWLCKEHGFSFPSGHTLNNTVFFLVLLGLLCYYYKNKGKSLPIYKGKYNTSVYPKKKATIIVLIVVCILWPLTIALSRIYVGVHWPSDVIGSWLLAASILSAAYLVLFTERNK